MKRLIFWMTGALAATQAAALSPVPAATGRKKVWNADDETRKMVRFDARFAKDK